MTFNDIDFLIIGAAKSATTSMQRALQLDKSVYMPDPELHYFSREYHRGHSWYLSQFTPDNIQQTVGEKSNSYLDTPEAAARIRQILPDVKLIAQLRNPVERAYSDYCMLYRRAEVGRDIENYLDPRKAANNRFLRGGLYYEQLYRYLELYPREQILVVFFEDFKKNAQLQLSEVRSFLNLAHMPSSDIGQSKVKDKTSPMISPEMRRQLRWLKPVISPFRKFATFQAVRRLLISEIRYEPLTPELRNQMLDYYAQDVEKLAHLLGRDLSKWLMDTPSIRSQD